MFDECVIRGRRFAPARFCAPLAGYTHSAFRRLVAELGGCGAVWTEMLAARQILSENFKTSPWLRRRPQESSLVYQLMVNADDPMERILDRLGEAGADALDLNLACNAKSIRSCLAGSALFEDLDSLRAVLHKVRKTLAACAHRQNPTWPSTPGMAATLCGAVAVAGGGRSGCGDSARRGSSRKNSSAEPATSSSPGQPL